MLQRVAHIGIVALTIIWAHVSHAQDSRGMSFSVFWPCAGNASYCAPRILVSGVVERASAKQFLAFLSSARRTDATLPPKPAVCFNSLGGNLQGALELGRVIRQLGLDTCLASTYSRVIPRSGGDEEVFVRNAVCASACAFAMLGGVSRLIKVGSRYGVHQFSGKDGDVGDAPTQVTVVLLAAYLEEMSISRTLLDIASLVPANTIRWLTSDELRRLRVDNMVAVAGGWKLEALNDGTVVAKFSVVKPGLRNRVSLSIFKSEGRPILIIVLTPEETNNKALQEALEAVRGEPLTLVVDRRAVASYDAPQWHQVGESILVSLPLTSRVIGALRTGGVLAIDVSVARAYGHYDPSVEVSLREATPMFAAALK